jgi:flavodoxin
MKKILFALLCAGGLVLTANAQTTGRKGNILVAFWSWSGNDRAVARQIASELKNAGRNVTVFEITTVETWPSQYHPTTDKAKQEQTDNARPALAGTLPDMANYDSVFLGWPCWWGDMPMPMYSFLEKENMNGKTIYPFTCHGGSGFGRGLISLSKEAPGATVKDGLAIYVFSTKQNKPGLKTPDKRITEWLDKTGLAD